MGEAVDSDGSAPLLVSGGFLHEASVEGEDPLELILSGPSSGDVDVVRMDAPVLLIGRAAGCDLRLLHPDISRRHALVQRVGRRVLVVDLGSRSGLRVNDERIGAAWLSAGDEVQIGPYALRRGVDSAGAAVTEEFGPLSAAFSPTATEYAVRVLNGGSGSLEVPLSRLVTLVGRAEVCRLRLSDASVSGVHASLSRCRGGLLAVDLLGRGGVSVNDRPIRRAVLSMGDRLQIGGYLMEVIASGAPAHAGTGSDGGFSASERDSSEAHLAACHGDGTRLGGTVNVTISVAQSSAADLASAVSGIQRSLDEHAFRQAEMLAGMFESMRRSLKDEICKEIREEIRNEFDRLREISEEISRLQRVRPEAAAALSTVPLMNRAAARSDERRTASRRPSEGMRSGAPAGSGSAQLDYGWVAARLRELESERAGRRSRLARLLGRDS